MYYSFHHMVSSDTLAEIDVFGWNGGNDFFEEAIIIGFDDCLGSVIKLTHWDSRPFTIPLLEGRTRFIAFDPITQVIALRILIID